MINITLSGGDDVVYSLIFIILYTLKIESCDHRKEFPTYFAQFIPRGILTISICALQLTVKIQNANICKQKRAVHKTKRKSQIHNKHFLQLLICPFFYLIYFTNKWGSAYNSMIKPGLIFSFFTSQVASYGGAQQKSKINCQPHILEMSTTFSCIRIKIFLFILVQHLLLLFLLSFFPGKVLFTANLSCSF